MPPNHAFPTDGDKPRWGNLVTTLYKYCYLALSREPEDPGKGRELGDVLRLVQQFFPRLAHSLTKLPLRDAVCESRCLCLLRLRRWGKAALGY